MLFNFLLLGLNSDFIKLLLLINLFLNYFDVFIKAINFRIFIINCCLTFVFFKLKSVYFLC